MMKDNFESEEDEEQKFEVHQPKVSSDNIKIELNQFNENDNLKVKEKYLGQINTQVSLDYF